MLQNVKIIPFRFETVNIIFEKILEVRFSNDFLKFVKHISVEFWIKKYIVAD